MKYNHYSQEKLSSLIITAFERDGKNVDDLAREDITTLNEFCIKSCELTTEVVQLAGHQKDMKVLNLGCSVGGDIERTYFDEEEKLIF